MQYKVVAQNVFFGIQLGGVLITSKIPVNRVKKQN